MVFYPKRAFDAAGYEVPTTWEELLALSSQMVADGRDPWCFQWEAGVASGFAGSDFLESLVLRFGGVDAGFVAGGPESISQTDWSTAALRLLDEDPLTGEEGPQCWLSHQGAQMIDILGPPGSPDASRLGVDVDYFMLPSPEVVDVAPVNGALSLATALTDRPEVRALMAYIASPRWGEVMAGMDTVGETFFSANRRFDTDAYEGQRDQANIDVRQRIHADNRAALDAGVWRFDASDNMPLEFSTWTDEYVPGPFWQGMLDWADGVKPIEEILAEIQAAREAFDGPSAPGEPGADRDRPVE